VYHHPHTACSLNSLALLYNNQGRYDQAEPLYHRALATWEKALGPDRRSAKCIESVWGTLRTDNTALLFSRRACRMRVAAESCDFANRMMISLAATNHP
jgi:tetratricopeptide (TPR) repeat protein